MQSDSYIPTLIGEQDRERHRRSGLGKRVGIGQKIALLVVDMCRYITEDQFVLSCGAGAQATVEHISTLLAAVRPLGIPVIYTTQRTEEPYSPATGGRLLDKAIAPDSHFAQDLAPHEIVGELTPEPGETVLVKPKPSAFFGTQLVSLLVYDNIDTLVVTGATTSGCIRATVDDAAARNFRVIIPTECVVDRFQISHEVELFNMDAFLADVMPLETLLDYLSTLNRPETDGGQTGR